MATDPRFWAGRRVLVTGHTGFKGAWLALWLVRQGARVHGLALPPPTSPSLFEAADIAALVPTALVDLRDAAATTAAVRAATPEVVVHLAAQSLVRRSYHEPVETFASNVMGTAHLLEAVRATPSVRAVVVATSDKCYENSDMELPFAEGAAMGGHDPYSASKGCTELLVASWRRSFLAAAGVGVATVRAGNVIGGGDWGSDRLVPDLMRGFAAGSEVVIRNPGSVRPWQHVLEPLTGYLAVAERMVAGDAGCAEAWNFGPDAASEVPAGVLAEGARERWPGGRLAMPWERSGPHEARVLRLDSGKARTRLGWRPQLDLPATLDWTVAWYRAYAQDPGSARAMTWDQIDRFAAMTAPDRGAALAAAARPGVSGAARA